MVERELIVQGLQGSKNGHKGNEDGKGKGKGKGKGQSGPRSITIDRGNEAPGHVPNSIKTAKYNVITFLPIFIVEMFSRMAYLYFLAQVRPPTFTSIIGF